MDFEEELKVLNVFLSICEGVSKTGFDGSFITDFVVTPETTIRLNYNDLGVFNFYRLGDKGPIEPVFKVDTDSTNFFNLRNIRGWHLIFNPRLEGYNDFRVVYNTLYPAEEDILKEFTKNGRMMTDEEYFQATCIHPDIPERSVMEKCLEVMNNRSDILNKNTFSMMFRDYANLKFARKLRRMVIHQLGIDIDVNRKL